MKKTRHTTEQIIRILRDAEAGRLTTDEVCPPAKHQSADLLPLEEQVWRHEVERSATVEGVGEGEHRTEETSGRSAAQDQGPGDCPGKKHLSPARQREVAALVRSKLSCSGRSLCRWLCFNRSSMRYRPKPLPPKKRLLEAQIVKVSREHPTLGYKKVIGLMRSMGYRVNKKLVQADPPREKGLQVPPPRLRERCPGLSTGLPQQAAHRKTMCGVGTSWPTSLNAVGNFVCST